MVPRVQSTYRGSTPLTPGQLRRGDTHRTLLTGRLESAVPATELNVQSPNSVEPPVENSMICDSCPHPTAVHDRVARRYCEATQRTALTRRCICRGDMVDVEQEPTSARRFP
jgi:hypothetical protein